MNVTDSMMGQDHYSGPMSVLRYELYKVRYLDLKSYLTPVLFFQIKRLMVEIEFNVYLDRRFEMNLMFSKWMFPL